MSRLLPFGNDLVFCLTWLTLLPYGEDSALLGALFFTHSEKYL